MAEPHLPKQLRVTNAYLHVISVSHLLLGLAVIFSGAFRFIGQSFAAFLMVAILGVFLIVLAVGFEIVNSGLKELGYWAWVTALIAGSLHLFLAVIILLTLGSWGMFGSFVFLILGIIGLLGLLAKDTRKVFLARKKNNEAATKLQAT